MRVKLLLIMAWCCCRVLAQTGEDLYNEGMRRMGEKNYTEAEKFFSKAIEVNKDSAKYFVQRGRANYHLQKFQDAYHDYSAAIHIDKGNALAYLYRSFLLLDANKPDESIRDGNMAIMLTTEDSVKKRAYMNNGVARSHVRDFGGAERDLETALKYDSLDPGIYNNLGMVYGEQGDTIKAIFYNQKALKLDSAFLPALSNIGFIRTMAGNYKAAIESYNKALRIDPQSAFVYNNRGFAKMKMGDMKGALADINRSIKLFPSNSYAYRNRALLYIQQKKFKKSCADLHKAQELGFKQMYGDEVEKLLKQYCH